MTLELAQIVAAWPLGASLAAALGAREAYAGRRRAALNEALHELRRPLQVLALAAPEAGGEESSPVRSSLQLAAAALDRLEREINGEAVSSSRAPLPGRSLVEDAVARWRPAAG